MPCRALSTIATEKYAHEEEKFEYASSEDICASRCAVAVMMLRPSDLVAACIDCTFDLAIVRAGKKSECLYAHNQHEHDDVKFEFHSIF